MSNLMHLIKERRSIRKFTDQEIQEQDLQTILEAIQWAPSWANTQCWEIVIVKDQEIKTALQGTMGKGNPATKAIVAAPVLLAICAKLKASGFYKGLAPTKFGDWFMFDLGLATQNACLAAHDLGLGTVIVGLFGHDQAAKILKLQPDYEVVCLLPLGYPAQSPKPPKRKDLTEFVHYDHFRKP